MSVEDGVRTTLHAYCRMLDDRALERLDRIYLPDAVDDRKRGAPLRGLDEIRAYFERSMAVLQATAHILTNIDVTIDGDRATSYSRVTAYHWMNGGDPVRAADFVLLASYDDQLVHTPQGWRIAGRTIGVLGPAGLGAGELPAIFAGFGGKSATPS